jgi:hypothetical protein
VKYLRIKAPHEPKIRQGARLVILFLALGVLSLSAAQTVFADGGGWPTLTPTFVLFPTATPQPTTAPYPYPKALPLQMQAALPSPTFFLPTQAAETGIGSTFACWPFALALLLVVILGSTVLFRRVKT